MDLKPEVFKCPYCETKCRFAPIKNAERYCKRDKLFYSSWYCENCNGIIIMARELVDPIDIARMIPSIKCRPKIRIDRLPENIAIDYLEALSNYSEDCLTSSVIMCRRIIQSTCYDKGAKKDTLYNQIEGLDIDKNLKELAHKIRFWGNSGAHPDILLDETVSKDDAINAIDFTEKFLQFVYIIPKELEELRNKI